MSPRHGPPLERLDQLLVARGLAPTRTKAQALILAGSITSRGMRLEKPGLRLPADAPLEVAAAPRFVSRSGAKLEAAIRTLGVEVAGRPALDVGASTGGFTQALLLAGASRVIALDVGRGQLDWTLRNDERVIVLDGINARYLDPSDLPLRPILAVIDVSFISLERVLPAVIACLQPGGEVVALIKPQFEVGRGKVGRGGIVRDPALHREALQRICSFARGKGWAVKGLVRSALAGAEGNQEFFVRLALEGSGLDPNDLSQAILGAAAAPEETLA